MPYALAQSATNHNDLLDKIIAFITARSATVAAVSAGGTGYAIGEVLTLTGGTSSIATELVVLTLSGSAVATVRISQSGAYTSIPGNPVSSTASGSGTGATFTMTFNTDNGWAVNRRTQTAASAVITVAGTGHAVGDVLTVSGGVEVDTAAQFTIDEVGAASGVLAAGGTGYTINDTLTLTGGTFSSAATFNVDSESGGVVTAVSLVSAGSYTVVPGSPVSTSGGTGTLCTITVTFGVATVESLLTAGKYATVPSNPAATTSSGSGINTTLTVTYANLTSANFDAYIQGEGSGADSIFVQLRTFTEGSANNMELRGATGYTEANDFNTQPGISPGDHTAGLSQDRQGCYTPLDNSSITYWLFVSGRRIIGIFKVGSTYTNFYLGWLNPFGTAAAFPYPLVIAGCSSEFSRLFSSGDSGYSGMLDPISDDSHNFAGPMAYRDAAGVWQQINNSQGAGAGRNSKDDFVCWPAGTPGVLGLTTDDIVSDATNPSTDLIPNSGSPGNPTAFMKQTPETTNDISLLWPTMIIREGNGGSIPRDMHGELESVFWTTADISGQAAVAASEDTFTDPASGQRYHFFQNCNRTDLFTFFVIQEE